MGDKTPEEMAEEYIEDHDECEHAREAWLAGYHAAMANSPEKPEGSELAFKSIEPAREVFRICYTSDGFDIKLADGVTMTEAAEMFINMVKGRLATKEE